MNLLEAINGCGENWFRPAKPAWRGQAIAIEDNCTILVPDDIGQGITFMICDIDTITGEWEIVTQEKVWSEIDRINEQRLLQLPNS